MGLRYSFERCIRFLNWAQLGGGKDDGWRFESFQFSLRSVAEPWHGCSFGASGDLAKRKVIPAHVRLAIHNGLGPRYAIVGFARTPMSETPFAPPWAKRPRASLRSGPSIPSNGANSPLTFTIVPETTETRNLTRSSPSGSPEVEAAKTFAGNRLFYLSTPPEVYRDIVEHLGPRGASLARVRPNSGCASSLRKPFGRDLAFS